MTPLRMERETLDGAGTTLAVHSLEPSEAFLEVVAALLVVAAWVFGGFPEPDGAAKWLFAAGIVLAGLPALRRLVAFAAGGRPYRRAD